jgi:hypothetical protein
MSTLKVINFYGGYGGFQVRNEKGGVEEGGVKGLSVVNEEYSPLAFRKGGVREEGGMVFGCWQRHREGNIEEVFS